MDINILQVFILFVVGVAAGVLNTLAGGGSFITVPVLIFTGLEPTIANATNRLGILFQSIFGVRKFKSMGYFPKNYSYTVAIPAAFGALFGAYLATIITDDAFRKYFAFFMIIMTFVTFFKPSAKELKDDVVFTSKSLIINTVAFFFIGMYSGFVQAGVGFLMIAGAVLAGLDMVRANAVKMFLNLITATMSVAIFIYGGKILFIPGIALGIGMSIGAVVGAGFSVKVSNNFLKRLVSVIIFVFAILLLVLK
ncbi:MAG: integrase [Denitrovibrio sp.]|nr:MAG: integrase [Denitrovibrio sp.]